MRGWHRTTCHNRFVRWRQAGVLPSPERLRLDSPVGGSRHEVKRADVGLLRSASAFAVIICIVTPPAVLKQATALLGFKILFGRPAHR
jgi:hypothetical protein